MALPASGIKATFMVFILFLLLSLANARPYKSDHAVKERALVTDVTTIELPEVVNWIDYVGKTITVETKGKITTHRPTHHVSSDNQLATTFRRYDTALVTVCPTTANPISSISQPAPDASYTSKVEITSAAITPTDTKSASVAKPTASTPTEVKPTEPKPTEPKPTELKPPAAKPTVESRTSNAQITQTSAPEPSRGLPTSTTVPDLPKNPAEKFFSGKGFGICYAPYTANGHCKTQSEVYADFAKLHEYDIVRSYGVDCNQIEMMLNAAKRYNKKVMLGLFTIQHIGPELNIFIAAARDNWSHIFAVAIGNEVVNTGKSSARDLVNAVGYSRGILRSAGFSGPVVAVDTVNAMTAYPEICHVSDFCAVNIHPFFDPHTSAVEAGRFVRQQAKAVSDAVHGAKRVIVTETGWPHNGQQNGRAIPSKQNQHMALESLKKAFQGTNGELFLFSAFDDPWKQDGSNTFGAEKFWGLHS